MGRFLTTKEDFLNLNQLSPGVVSGFLHWKNKIRRLPSHSIPKPNRNSSSCIHSCSPSIKMSSRLSLLMLVVGSKGPASCGQSTLKKRHEFPMLTQYSSILP